MRIVFALLGLVACAPVEGKIAYGKIDAHPLTLDLAAPPGPGPFPAILFIHGGGWTIGDLARYHPALEAASARDFAGVTINYRLAREDSADGGARWPWPAQLQDVRCALRWMRTQPEIDPDRIATFGDSAGGQLAMMAAYAEAEAAFEPDCPGDTPEVRAVVSFYGVSDLARVYDSTEPWLKQYIARWLDLPEDATTAAHAEAFARASPVTYLTGPKRPARIFQGDEDKIVRPETQRAFVSAAQAAGQDVTLTVVEGYGHDDALIDRSLDEALDWLESKLSR